MHLRHKWTKWEVYRTRGNAPAWQERTCTVCLKVKARWSF
jgi:hypothetical protein